MNKKLSPNNIGTDGRAIYEKSIRKQVETEDNLGRLVSIDINTGNFAVGGDSDFEAYRTLIAKTPDATIYTIRIGYNAVYSLCGVLERTTGL